MQKVKIHARVHARELNRATVNILIAKPKWKKPFSCVDCNMTAIYICEIFLDNRNWLHRLVQGPSER
jgi:hypothetical protein